MIVPAGHPAVFGSAADGDGRSDIESRRAIARRFDLPIDWAVLQQVHGSDVVVAEGPGLAGEGDGIVTTRPGLPVAVATADCFPVVLSGPGGVGIAHAGWRGAASGVVKAVRRALEAAGAPAVRAAIGPGIGPCCFEVGADVAERFPAHVSATTWGTVAVDLPDAIRTEVDDLEVWSSGICTHHGDGYHSFRRDGTQQRQVAVAWVSPA